MSIQFSGTEGESIKVIAVLILALLIGIGAYRTSDLDVVKKNAVLYRIAFSFSMAQGFVWFIEALSPLFGS